VKTSNLSTNLGGLNYDSFGMGMQGRSFEAGNLTYRFGYQEQEKDSEIYGNNSQYAFKYRMYNPRLGKFFSVDPLYKDYSHISPYAFCENKDIQFKELEGLQAINPLNGTFTKTTRTFFDNTYTIITLTHEYHGIVTKTSFTHDEETNNVEFGIDQISKGNTDGIRAARSGELELLGEFIRKTAVLIGPDIVKALNPGLDINSDEFKTEASRQSSEEYGKVFRHIAFAGLLTKLYGEDFTKDLTDYYDRGNPNSPIEISYRDIINNKYGIEFGKSFEGNLETREDIANYLNSVAQYVYDTFDIDANTNPFTSDDSIVKALYETLNSGEETE